MIEHKRIRFMVFVLIWLCSWGCPANQSQTRLFLQSLDDAAVITQQARVFIEFLADQGSIQPQTGLNLLKLTDRLDSANREILLESRNYLVIDSKGNKVLKFNETGKANIQRLTRSFQSVSQSLINDQGFLDLKPDDRKRWEAITKSLAILVLRSVSFVDRIRAA